MQSSSFAGCSFADCSAAGKHLCSRCRSAAYCCAEHQKAAWPTHKAECKFLATARQYKDAAMQAAQPGGLEARGSRGQAPVFPGSLAPPSIGDAKSMAGQALAQKKAFIARELGLDPSMPLAELMAAASKATGMTTPKMNKSQLGEAEGLIAASRPKAAETRDAPSMPCKSCGQHAKQLSVANGCCARCLFQVSHFQNLGHQATSQGDEAELARLGGSQAHTYGEVTTIGFRQLCARMELSTSDVFVDLGSGTGQLVQQAAREYGVRRAIGIELSGSRHQVAIDLHTAAAASIATARKQRGLRDKRGSSPVLFLQADCADLQLWTAARTVGSGSRGGSLVGATAVFTCSIMFDDSLMARIARCIEACPTVRVVASFRRFPSALGGLRGFAVSPPTELCETTWTAPKHLDDPPRVGSTIYIYLRDGAAEPSAAVALSTPRAAALAATPEACGAVEVLYDADGDPIEVVPAAVAIPALDGAALGPELEVEQLVTLERDASGFTRWRFKQ